jgi:catechol 2,3-dioxygenase-like lactoylglutathione lyase family enzyme
MKRVIGIGGVFLKAADPERLHHWYEAHLGMRREDWGGVIFHWKDAEQSQRQEGRTVFAFFPKDTTYFEPSKAPYMINFRVEDLAGTLAELAEEGVEIEEKRQEDENGKFAWIHDPEGNRIELWEPPQKG